MNKAMAFITGALIGLAAGAGAALLLAPASGHELQDQAWSWVDRLGRDARRAADDKRLELEDQLAALKGLPVSPGPR